MDGKKRIARLRNEEKWKKLGFGAFRALVAKPASKKPKKKKLAQIVGIAEKFVKREDGKVWDCWSCTWRDPPPNGVFGSAHRIIDKLQKKGYKQLGSGHYSTVLAHPKCSDKVIKVTRHQDNWIDYVKWASEKGYAGKFAPKVYSWKKFPGGWSWAVMERMEHTLDAGYDWRDDCDYGNSEDSVPSKENDYSLIFALLEPAGRGNTMAQVYMEDLVPGAFAFVKELRSVMRASDIRGANTMVRKDGSLCFTDPCAGETKITVTRLRSGDLSPSIWRYYETHKIHTRPETFYDVSASSY